MSFAIVLCGSTMGAIASVQEAVVIPILPVIIQGDYWLQEHRPGWFIVQPHGLSGQTNEWRVQSIFSYHSSRVSHFSIHACWQEK